MAEWKKRAVRMIIIGLIIIVGIQYLNNNKLKDTAGSTYLSNITNFVLHIYRLENYLENEKEFSESDLSFYIYEINYLSTVRLPTDSRVSSYIQLIDNGLATMKYLTTRAERHDEFEAARKSTLQLVYGLKDGLERMSRAGVVNINDGYQTDFKKYYQLSLPKNEIMEAINADFDKQLKEHMEYLNEKG